MRRGIGIGVVLLLILAARAIDTHVSLVEAHGGAISARSESGKGTTMRFTLPVWKS